ncbi:response regulator [Singulisphaera rosea]
MTKILLVEDNDENCEMLSRRLTRRGYEVIVARDGQEAVEAAAAESPDLILMDMNMPIIDGWEATRRIRARPETRGVPIIAVTAHGMEGDREKILEAGCGDHHTKPVELPRLLAQIEAMLKKVTGNG